MGDSLISPAEAAESPLAGFATLPAVGPSVRISGRMSGPWALDLEKARQAREHGGRCLPLAPEQPDRVPGAKEQSVLLAQNTALERTAVPSARLSKAGLWFLQNCLGHGS